MLVCFVLIFFVTNDLRNGLTALRQVYYFSQQLRNTAVQTASPKMVLICLQASMIAYSVLNDSGFELQEIIRF